jgi:hypothetical protein
MARPITTGLSKTMELAFDDPLSAEEKESNVLAFAALFYQRGGQLDATWLVGLSMLGIVGPRLAKYLADEKRAKERERQRLPAKPEQREALKTVEPAKVG